MSADSDDGLVDKDEFASIFGTYKSQLLSRINSRISMNPFADFSAEDVLQEAQIDALLGFPKLRSRDPASIGAWLNKIVDNRLAQMFRDRSRAKRGGKSRKIDAQNPSLRDLLDDLADESEETGSSRLLKTEIKTAIRDAIEELPEIQRQIVEEYYLNQKALGVIAADMSMTQSAARSHLYRAKVTLKTLLGNSSRWYTKK